jgi:hypothetical protein
MASGNPRPADNIRICALIRRIGDPQLLNGIGRGVFRMMLLLVARASSTSIHPESQ